MSKKLGPITNRKDLWSQLPQETRDAAAAVDQVFGLKGIAYYEGGALVGAFSGGKAVEAEGRLEDWEVKNAVPVTGPALPDHLVNSRGKKIRRR